MTPLHSSLETKLAHETLPPYPDATSEIIHVTKRRKLWSAKVKYAAEYPHKALPNHYGVRSANIRTTGGFGGVMDGAVIVGNLVHGKISEPKF